jgi:hypothetical protein
MKRLAGEVNTDSMNAAAPFISPVNFLAATFISALIRCAAAFMLSVFTSPASRFMSFTAFLCHTSPSAPSCAFESSLSRLSPLPLFLAEGRPLSSFVFTA